MAYEHYACSYNPLTGEDESSSTLSVIGWPNLHLAEIFENYKKCCCVIV